MAILKSVFLMAGLFVARCVFSQTAPANGPRHRGVPPAPDLAAVARGRKLFGQTCSFCHGRDANGGDGGPDLIRSALVNHDEHGNLIGPVVLNGRPDKGMPSFSTLTPEQISDIASFLHGRVRSIRYRQLYQVKNLTGNAAEGKAFFAQHCSSCHSSNGDLNHIAAKYKPETLMTKMLFPASRSTDLAAAGPKTQVTATVTLSSGQTFSGRLMYMDEFTVSLYDTSGAYHTWDRSRLKIEVHDPLAAHVNLVEHYTDDQMHNVLAYLETFK